MSSLRPVAVYGLTVPVGEEPVPAFDPGDYPATFKLTMAALNPFEKPEPMEGETTFTGATLKIIRIPGDDSDEEDSDEDDFDMAGLLDGASSDEDEDEDDEEANGGPSDPEKSSKARKMAVLKEALASSSDDMDVDDATALSAKAKGKGKAVDLDDEDDSEDEDDEEFLDAPEEFVLCTLDPTKTYQQSLDITINEHERVYFQVSGTHTVYLTGNILIPDEEDMYDSEDQDEDEEDYDLTPDDDELDLPDGEDESDELDDIDDPRVTEVASDEEAAIPKLVKTGAQAKKGKNKRPAPESDEEDLAGKLSIDDILAKSLKKSDKPAEAAQVNGEQKLSKKQQKKLKNNAGNAVEPKTAAGASKEDVGTKVTDASAAKQGVAKGDKKSVQFAKTLVQGPSSTTGTPEAAKSKPAEQAKVNGEKPTKATPGVKTVQGVVIDDKKLGSGPAAKKGDKVSMRYIGKLDKDKKVFDSNKKGKPFTFKLGAEEVIKGWEIGVAGMAAGGERRIVIPPHLAYGSKKMDGIPPNSTLVFDLKLLEVK